MPDNQHHDPFEDRLSAALRGTGGAFEADRTALVAGGEKRGRRARTRRRAGVLGGVAGVALAGVGGVLLLPDTHANGPDRSAAAVGGDSRPTATTTASASPAPDPVSGEEILDALKEALPQGEISAELAGGTDDETGPYAHLIHDDGKGGAAISLSFARVEPGGAQVRELTRCPDKTFVPYDGCTTARLPDGSVLRLFQGYEYPDRRVDTKFWSADLVTADGRHVLLSEWNSPAQKGAPVSRPEPPLSTDQLKEVVTAEVWRRVVDAMPEPEKQKPGTSPGSDAPPPGASGKEITETLTALLPEGLEVVRRGGQETEFAYVVVDDGRGESLVQVNVQLGMADAADELFADGETLPDGTRVTVREGTGDDRVAGAVMWTADTLRPGGDGFRVVISAFNNGAQHAEPSRGTPALTTDQLREIALSSQWEKLR